MKIRFTAFIVVVVCVAILAGCSKKRDPEEAWADYEMTGTLVSADTGEPVKGMVVSITKVTGNRSPIILPTTTTDTRGRFTLVVNSHYTKLISFVLSIKNPAGLEEGAVRYEESDREVVFQNASFVNSAGDFFAGTATKNLKEITLTPVE